MSWRYSQRDVEFVVPDGWIVSEDDFDEVIRAITLGPEGECMVDLYKSEQAPTLEAYVENQTRHYLNALPRDFQIVAEPLRSAVVARHRGLQVEGVKLQFAIRSKTSRIEYGDVNCFYRLDGGRYTAMCSLRCSDDEYAALRAGFEEFLESFHVAGQ